MKKLLFIIIVLSCYGITFSQNYNFEIAKDISTQSVSDTIFIGSSDISDISSYLWTATISSIGLDSIIIVDFGSSNNLLTNGKYGFEGFASDSLPCIFSQDKYPIDNEGVTTYQKTFMGVFPWGFKKPQVKVTNQGCTIGVYYIRMRFIQMAKLK